jgi:hypothetical protein
MLKRISEIIFIALISGSLSAAVDRSASSDAARIEVRGTMARDGNRPVLRAGDSAYVLEFPNSSLREFASSMAGERVVVRGELRTRRQNGATRLAIRPDYIGREGGSEEVSIDSGNTFNVSVDDETPVAPPRSQIRVTDVPERYQEDYENDVAPPRNRWEARKRAVLNRNRRDWSTRVVMPPGGGTIILENQ